MEEEPVHKPRRARGTPAHKYSLKLSAYFLTGCFISHLLISEINKQRMFRKIAAGWYDASELMKQKRRVMSNFSPIPNVRSGPELEWNNYESTLNFEAESPVDIDL